MSYDNDIDKLYTKILGDKPCGLNFMLEVCSFGVSLNEFIRSHKKYCANFLDK